MGCWLTIYIIRDKNDPITKYTSSKPWKNEHIDHDIFKKRYGFEPWDYIDSLPHIDYEDNFDTDYNENFPDFPVKITGGYFMEKIKQEFTGDNELIEMLEKHLGEFVVGFYQ